MIRNRYNYPTPPIRDIKGCLSLIPFFDKKYLFLRNIEPLITKMYQSSQHTLYFTRRHRAFFVDKINVKRVTAISTTKEIATNIRFCILSLPYVAFFLLLFVPLLVFFRKFRFVFVAFPRHLPFSLKRDKAWLTRLHMHPAKIQISLRIRAVWSESSQGTPRGSHGTKTSSCGERRL